MENSTLKSQIYKLYELRAAIEKGISITERVIVNKEQHLHILTSYKYKKDEQKLEEEFISELKEDLEKTKKELMYAKNRLALVSSLIEINDKQDEESEKLNNIITTLFYGLGITRFDEPEEKEE